MMSALYKNINWNNVQYVGYDMDGTLYDEYEFIIQPYLEISKHFLYPGNAFAYMTARWLEKGSSYNQIFDEAYNMFDLSESNTKDKFIKLALDVFRKFDPELQISVRVKSILEYTKNNYDIFLVSDGNPVLQEKKYNALGLSEYFADQNVIFTGLYPTDHHKPNVKSIDLLDIVPEVSVFFGDRENDRVFAASSNMQFEKVYNMISVS